MTKQIFPATTSIYQPVAPSHLILVLIYLAQISNKQDSAEKNTCYASSKVYINLLLKCTYSQLNTISAYKMGWTESLAVCISIAVVIITYYKWAFTFWKKRNLPVLEPTIPFGSIKNPFTSKTTTGVIVKDLYDKLKSRGYKHAGYYIFSKPGYMVIDPEFVKNVLQRDFQYFTERGFYYNEKDEPLSAHLFALGGERWKNLRTKLTQTFTSGKMKMMFETLIQCGHQMVDAMDGYHEQHQAVDIKELLACYTTDIIGSCAFGLDCNSFKSPDADFRKHGRNIFKPPSIIQNAWLILATVSPSMGRFFHVKMFHNETTDFFMNIVKETVRYREANGIERKDMLKLLIDLKNSENGLTIEELAAQVFLFFFAGFETPSMTMTFCLLELSKNPAIQEKARKEVNQVLEKHEGKITYDAIMDMKYMNQVVDETLRKYPPVPFITRQSVQDYKVPNTDVVIPKGVNVVIPILGIHHDPEYYPEPEKFDPERFSDENKHKLHPFTYLAFGEGPRICIGLRFGLMQTKVGLAFLLKNYKFSVSNKTVDPKVMDRYSFILTLKTGIFLDVEKV